MTLEDLFSEIMLEQNIELINQNLKSLSLSLGRVLSQEEEEAILLIVDNFTPKNNEGHYKYPLIPFDYAWQIYCVDRINKQDNWLN